MLPPPTTNRMCDTPQTDMVTSSLIALVSHLGDHQQCGELLCVAAGLLQHVGAAFDVRLGAHGDTVRGGWAGGAVTTDGRALPHTETRHRSAHGDTVRGGGTGGGVTSDGRALPHTETRHRSAQIVSSER